MEPELSSTSATHNLLLSHTTVEEAVIGNVARRDLEQAGRITSLAVMVTETGADKAVRRDGNGGGAIGGIALVIGGEIFLRQRQGGVVGQAGGGTDRPGPRNPARRFIAERTIMAAREIQPGTRRNGEGHQRKGEHHRDIAAPRACGNGAQRRPRVSTRMEGLRP